MKKPLTLFLFALFSLTLFSVAFGQGKGGTGKFQAVVGKDEAIFTFPIKPQQQYDWSEGRALLYAWLVKINNKNRNYEVGYSLATPSTPPIGSGNFRDLLDNGQFDVWAIVGKVGSVVKELSVEGFASDKQDKLTIKVTGIEAVQLLFSGKPKSVVFYTKILSKSSSLVVPVTYTGK